MNELIPIYSTMIAGAEVRTVDGRELHAFLGIGRDFSNWMKDRIQQYGFAEGHEYWPFSHSPDLASGNRGARVEYRITLEMAKELAMVERNDRGKQARQYFIACERQLRTQMAVPRTYGDALRAAAVEFERAEQALAQNAALEATVEAQAPKVAALELIAESEGRMALRLAAKNLGMSPFKFRDWLLSMHWIYRTATANERLAAYQHYIDSGHLEHKLCEIRRATPEEPAHHATQVLVTAKGLAKLAALHESNRIAQDRAAREARERIADLLVDESAEEVMH